MSDVIAFTATGDDKYEVTYYGEVIGKLGLSSSGVYGQPRWVFVYQNADGEPTWDELFVSEKKSKAALLERLERTRLSPFRHLIPASA